jgi:hypothetical protein
MPSRQLLDLTILPDARYGTRLNRDGDRPVCFQNIVDYHVSNASSVGSFIKLQGTLGLLQFIRLLELQLEV